MSHSGTQDSEALPVIHGVPDALQEDSLESGEHRDDTSDYMVV